MFKAWVAGIVLVTAWPTMAVAQGSVDQQLWLQVLATGRLSENWRWHLEEWPRLSADASGPFQILTRAAVGRQLHPRATVWGGYAWIAKPPGPGITHEQRTWQQLSVSLPSAGLWAPSLRVRTEQRFQDTWDGSSHRLRLMGRAVRPLNAERSWSFAASNELLVTLDETPGGPWQGVDQNRVFAGLQRPLHRAAFLEFGYLWTTTQPPGRDRSHAHGAFAWLNLAF